MAYVTPSEVAKQIGKPALANDPVDWKLQACCDAAEFHLNDVCGRTESLNPVPAGMHVIALSYAIDWYKQADATFGVIGNGETGMLRMGRDLAARYEAELIPYYDPLNGWGVA
jgi:hypothetical protein